MSVNPSTEQRLRAAMKRLADGRPSHTDGAYTVSNLAREAQVSRATANRAVEILDEFRAARQRTVDAGKPTAQDGVNEKALRKRVSKLSAEITRIQEEKEALALATLVLFEENCVLAERLQVNDLNVVRRINSARADEMLQRKT